jgi:hypothetical protein
VKQAEVFASVRESYEITRDDKLKLREFPTLAHVIRFVYDKRPDLVGPSGARLPESEVAALVSQTSAKSGVEGPSGLGKRA